MKFNSNISKQRGFLGGLAKIKSFFQFSNFSVYLVIAGIVAFGWFRITLLQSQNETLNERNSNLNDQVENLTIRYNDLVEDIEEFKDNIREDLEDQQAIRRRIDQIDRENRRRIDEIRQIFGTTASGDERDIERIALERPTLLERRINDATREIGREIERASESRPDSSNDESD